MGKEVGTVSVTSVGRVFGIVEELAKEPDLGLSELSKRIGMSKSTIFRFLQTMKSLGYVNQDTESERYSLTLKLFQVGSKVLNIRDITTIANRYMQDLSSRTSETVHLAILDKESKSIIYIHKINSDHSQAMLSRIGNKAPVHCTGLGKLLLAFSPDEVIEEILEGMEYKLLTPFTISNEKDLLKELERIRTQSYSEDVGEREENLYCMAVPIMNRFNEVIAGLSITWTEFRFDDSQKDTFLEWMFNAAKDISSELGNIE